MSLDPLSLRKGWLSYGIDLPNGKPGETVRLDFLVKSMSKRKTIRSPKAAGQRSIPQRSQRRTESLASSVSEVIQEQMIVGSAAHVYYPGISELLVVHNFFTKSFHWCLRGSSGWAKCRTIEAFLI